jgi:hypothetical protein
MTDIVERAHAYLADPPMDGRHSDAAGADAYGLIDEMIDEIRRLRELLQTVYEEIVRLREQVAARNDIINSWPRRDEEE